MSAVTTRPINRQICGSHWLNESACRSSASSTSRPTIPNRTRASSSCRSEARITSYPAIVEPRLTQMARDSSLQVAEPRIGAAQFLPRVPPARRIENHQHRDPDQVDPRQTRRPTWRLGDRETVEGWRLEDPPHLVVANETSRERQ